MTSPISIYQAGGHTVVLLSRDANGKRVKTVDSSLTPHFYIPDPNGPFKSLYGKRLRQMKVKDSSQVKLIREHHPETYESDVIFTTRYLIDRVPTPFEQVSLRIAYIDIETVLSLDPWKANKPIAAITCYDNFLKAYIQFACAPNLQKETIKEPGKSVFLFDDEKEMLKMFLLYIKDTDPDILSGWNSNNYDLPYLWNRCKQFGLPFEETFSYTGQIRYDEKWQSWSIPGRYPADLLFLYTRPFFRQSKLDSYKLEDVAQKELGTGKQKYDIQKLARWEQFTKEDTLELLNYNFIDVELCKRLDEKCGIISFFDTLRRIVGCRWEDTKMTSLMNDVLGLRLAKQMGLVLPRRPKTVWGADREKQKGAVVFTPVPGVHENVVVVDFSRLYPSLVLSFNLSPETLDEKGTIVLPNGRKFRASPAGVIPHGVALLVEQRALIKKMMKNPVLSTEQQSKLNEHQYSLKVLANAFGYGYLLFVGSRFFSEPVADSILSCGRFFITEAKTGLERHGFLVIAGDTDSLFVKLAKELTPEQVKAKSFEIASIVNEHCTKLAVSLGSPKCYIEMQAQDGYKSLFFGGDEDGGVKKRYSGFLIMKGGELLAKPELLVRGFEMRRADSAPIERDVQRHCFEIILNGGKFEEVVAYVDGIKQKCLRGEYPLEYIALRKGMTKEAKDYGIQNIYTKAAKYGNDHLGCSFKNNARLKLLFVNQMSEGFPPTEAIAFETESQVPKSLKINWPRMFERLFEKKLERMAAALGKSYGEYQHTKSVPLSAFC